MNHAIFSALTRVVCIVACFSGAAVAGAGQETQESEKEPETPREMSPTAAPFTRPDSTASIGFSRRSGRRDQFGVFDGQSRGDRELLLDTMIRKREDATGTWGSVQGRNLGVDGNRDVRMALEKQGDWGVRLEYSEILRQAPYSVNSKTEGLGTTLQVIPKTTTSGDGTTHQISTERDIFAANVFRQLGKTLKFNLGFRNETKEGTRQWGRGSGNEFVLEPIRWQTRQLEPTLSHVNAQWQLQGGYVGSWFRNDNQLVDTLLRGDNPATLASHTYLSLPLDNEAHQFFVSGGYNFAPQTRGTFKISHTRALQNEHLPTRDIAGLSLAAAPTSLQGEVDTTLVSLGMTAQPLPKLNMTAKLGYLDIRDRTPAWLVVDATTASQGRVQVHATPISSRTLSGLVEGTYRLPYQFSVTGGVEHKDQERQIPFGNDLNGDGMDDERFVPWRSELEETTFRVRVRRHLSATLNGTLGFEHSIRTGANYIRSVKIMGNSQGKISPFFIADRDRDTVRLSLDWRPMERLGLQFNVENALDRYDEQEPYGRREGSAQLYAVDADYALTDKWLFNAWYAYDTSKILQDSGRWGSAATPTAVAKHEADKSSELKDVGSTLGLGVRHQWNEQIKLGANLQRAQTRSSFADTVTVDPTSSSPAYPNGVTPLVDIFSPTTRLGAFVEYKGTGSGTLRCDLAHERWRTNDWTWKFSNGSSYVYGTTTDGTLISKEDDQTAHYIGLRYTTHFQ